MFSFGDGQRLRSEAAVFSTASVSVRISRGISSGLNCYATAAATAKICSDDANYMRRLYRYRFQVPSFLVPYFVA
jgi:hypothetical protein